MHAVLLGVVQQILFACIVVRKKSFSIKKQKVRELSSYILSIGPQLSSEFCRKPRSFIYLKRFKATDFRQLILYTLPVMLHSIMKTKYYNHFIKLHSAIRILCSKRHHIKLNERAKKLLYDFVKEFPILYSPQSMSFNVHCLLHIADDVKFMNAPLDDYSAFKFENFLQFLKKLPKCGYNVLEQIENRISERISINASLSFHDKFTEHFRMNKDGSYKYIIINNFKFSSNAPDNYFYCEFEKKVYKIIKIFNQNSITKFDCERVCDLEPIYNTCINSKKLGMFKTTRLKHTNLETKPFNSFIKMTHFIHLECHYFITLIH